MIQTTPAPNDSVVKMKVALRKSFRRYDVLLFSLCALIGLDTLGQTFDLTEEFGVSRLRFEVFTVDTFVVIIGLAVVGLLAGRWHRAVVGRGLPRADPRPTKTP